MAVMAAALAHEINQPLTAIANCAQASLREVERLRAIPDCVRRDLKLIASESLRAGTVLRQFRGLVAQRPIHKVPVDINAIVEQAVALLASDAKVHRVKLQVRLMAGRAIVIADEVLIQQVLINLVHNAIESVSAGSANERTVVIRSRVKDHYAEVRVRDRGIAATPDVIDSLFEPFVTTKPDGLGVGLAICKSIIERHGGQIHATRNRTKGMSFLFSIPLHQARLGNGGATHHLRR
jgi:two-component system sensor kinase FixL